MLESQLLECILRNWAKTLGEPYVEGNFLRVVICNKKKNRKYQDVQHLLSGLIRLCCAELVKNHKAIYFGGYGEHGTTQESP